MNHNTAKGLSQEGETFFDLFMRFSIVRWCAVHYSLKITAEMCVRRIVKILGGVGDGYFGFQQHPAIVGKLAVFHDGEFLHLGNEFVLVGKGHTKRLILAQTTLHSLVGIGTVEDGGNDDLGTLEFYFAGWNF